MFRVLVLCVLCALTLCIPSQLAAQSNLDGRWQFVLDTPGGERDVDVLFKVDGDNITGTWEFGEYKGDFKANRK